MLNGLLRVFGRQRWIRLGLRHRLIARFVDPATHPGFEFVVATKGVRFAGNVSSYIDWCYYFLGGYEASELDLLAERLRARSGALFLDIGANVGVYSVHLARYCGHVHAFEPFDVIARKLRRQIELNAIANVSVHEVGIGSETLDLDFYAPLRSRNTGNGSFLPAHDPENTLYRKLKVVRGDEYLATLQPQRVDLIKLDVEGYERFALEGLQETMSRFRPLVIMEFSNTTRTTFSSMDEFRQLVPGYRVNRVETDRPLLVFFNRPGARLSPWDYATIPATLLLEPEERP